MSPAIVSINSHSSGILFNNNGSIYKPVLASAGQLQKYRVYGICYGWSKVVKNHAIQSVKVSKQLAEKLCAEYLIKKNLSGSSFG